MYNEILINHMERHWQSVGQFMIRIDNKMVNDKLLTINRTSIYFSVTGVMNCTEYTTGPGS